MLYDLHAEGWLIDGVVSRNYIVRIAFGLVCDLPIGQEIYDTGFLKYVTPQVDYED